MVLATVAALQSGAAEADGAPRVATANPPTSNPVHTVAAFLTGAIPWNIMITSLSDL